MCPPMRSPTLAARSRLTRIPGVRAPRVLLAIDSAITSAVNQSAPCSTTVRQTPLTEIESPCLASDTASGARTVIRAASAVGDLRDVDVVLDAPVGLEARVDPDRLRQALDNLLANAVRHSPEHGVVTLTVTRHEGRVVFSVADDGPGFPEEFLPHAFERFRRADTARARSEGGSGLGLAIVETIARAHDGRVRAANRTEGGAVVEIDLPVSTGSAASEGGLPAMPPRAATGGRRVGDPGDPS